MSKNEISVQNPSSLHEELFRLTKKLNIYHHKGTHLNLESLDSPNFNISEFFDHNFVKTGVEKLVNYEKIETSVVIIQQI